MDLCWRGCHRRPLASSSGAGAVPFNLLHVAVLAAARSSEPVSSRFVHSHCDVGIAPLQHLSRCLHAAPGAGGSHVRVGDVSLCRWYYRCGARRLQGPQGWCTWFKYPRSSVGLDGCYRCSRRGGTCLAASLVHCLLRSEFTQSD